MDLRLKLDRPRLDTEYPVIRYAMVAFEAPRATGRPERPPVNVALVLDRSGSMAGRKLELARAGAGGALRPLQSKVRFAVVAYDNVVDVVMESTNATGEARRMAAIRLAEIPARGNTDLAGGWLAGATEVERHARPEGIGRVLLLTDGLANVGITSAEELVLRAAEFRSRGIATSTFGVGADFDERLLQAMADSGGGHSYFIEHPEQISDLLASELGEALTTTARDAVVRVTLPAGVGVRPLNALGGEPCEGGWIVRLGDLASEQQVVLVLELSFPPGPFGSCAGVSAELTDREGSLGRAHSEAQFRYVSHAESAAQPRDAEVGREVAALIAARARAEALEHNRAGRHSDAGQLLLRTASELREFAGSDDEVARFADLLESERAQIEQSIDAISMKKMFAASASRMRGRDDRGKAWRR